MLLKLNIQNYAIIDELNIQFAAGLNIITGETGAGKSILMGALDLVLGKRADTSILKSTDKKCVVEAHFEIKKNDGIHQFFAENDLDNEQEIIIRREINTNGKSRSFINDTPVNLNQLKELSNHVVDLHRQFDTLELGNANFQKEAIDALAENNILLQNLKQVFTKYNDANKKLLDLQAQQIAASKEADYNQFLLDEFLEINLNQNELEELEEELKLLSNAEHIKLQLSAIIENLNGGDSPLVQQLKLSAQKLQSVANFNTGIHNLHERLLATQIELKDVVAELENINDTIFYDEEKISKTNERLSAGYKLQKKHGVNSTNELLHIQNELDNKLQATVSIAEDIETLQKEAKQFYNEANKIAQQIQAKRKAQIDPFVKAVNKLLAQIGMPNAAIKIVVETVVLNETGIDSILFLFDANKSNKFEPLHKVASGGELSRLMLVIKSLLANKLQLPVLVFDEIDSGISGEAAKQVGGVMKSLSASHQVISITHQPQIAAKANAHYFVYKAIEDNTVKTSVKLLNNDERILAIAQMLSGEKPTTAALTNAKEMMN
jgi:DNA repair protein RecN (Recombination protein N)